MPAVGTPFVSLLRDYLHHCGIDPEPLIGATPTADGTVSIERWQAMLQCSADAAGDAAFGLHMAQYVTPRHFGLVGYLAASCATLAEGLQRGMRYGPLVAEHNPVELGIVDSELCLRWPPVHGPSGQIWDELGTGTLVSMIRLVAGPGFRATRVDFSGATPADPRLYDDFFGCRVHFQQVMPALAFPSRYLEMPLPGADAGLLALLDAQADEKLQRQMPLSGELQRLRQQLLQLIREGKTRLEDLAACNAISPRALQRRLARLDTGFQPLLDQTRRYLAEQYLADPGLELLEVAGLLGYSEQSSFTRAFQQWTGATPGQWRRTQARSSSPALPR